jgi:hypothetical protein
MSPGRIVGRPPAMRQDGQTDLRLEVRPRREAMAAVLYLVQLEPLKEP